MYLWNDEALALDLKENRVSENDKRKYLLYFIIIYGIIVIANKSSGIYVKEFMEKLHYWIIALKPLPAADPLTVSYYSMLITTDIIVPLIEIIIALIGVKACLAINQNGDNKNFIERFVCLAVPINIHVIVLGGIAYVLMRAGLEIGLYYFGPLSPLWRYDIDVTIQTLINLFFFGYQFAALKKCFRIINSEHYSAH